ncbi:hypothetical protein SCUCBS95973_000881 [Sporothrix curviconia]|uniref:Uncharacterized protein n=1 Tax=Sporothrix curviconia TaxID=1260050 RepID=A0ABP0ATZ6_9PEZI
MRLDSFQSLLLLAPAALASPEKRQAAANTPSLQDEAASLISVYVPSAVYTQLTASVASAASAASVTGDPASLFLSAIIATPPPAWFTSAVPPYFSSNIAALESAVSTLRAAGFTTTGTSTGTSTSTSSETLVVTQTTNSLGSTVTTSYTSTLHSSSTSTGRAAAALTVGTQQQAGMGIAALALGLAAML